MKRVTVSQLKNSLSAFLDVVRNGQSIVITDRDRAFAEIRGLSATAEGKASDAGERLERIGVVRRAQQKLPESFFLEELGGACPGGG